MNKPIYILGTGLSHDGSSCIMKDGKIIVAIEKERLSRKKHDGYNDNLTVQYCLDAAGISFKDIDLIVEKNTVNLEHDKECEKLKQGRIIPDDIPRVRISHHLAHAYSAIGTSPFEEMAVVIMDGRGASLNNCFDVPKESLPEEIRCLEDKEKVHYFEKESYYYYQNGSLTPVMRDFAKYCVLDRKKYPFAPNDMLHSIAELYGGVSQYIFGKDFTEGKLMGLAPYGNPKRYTESLFICKENRVFINYEVIKNIDYKKSGKYIKFWDNFQFFADIASWIQRETQRAVIYLFNCYYNLNPHEKVAYAGGLALNAVCNGQLIKETPFKDFYIQPAAGDNGLAIGCCYYGWLEVLKKEKVKHNKSTYFGCTYSEYTIKKSLEKYKDRLTFEKNEDYTKSVAEYIAEGKVIGWYQEGAEFGPRALGHRSILADPRRKEMRDYINREIKNREDFRPFAPSVLLEKAKDYFELNYSESPYMILVAQVREEWRSIIPSIVHEDGSARVQTVSKEVSPKYYELIKEFGKITDIPIVLNTSFNGKNMPIVETPMEAIQFFIDSKLDVLVLNNYIVFKGDNRKNDK